MHMNFDKIKEKDKDQKKKCFFILKPIKGYHKLYLVSNYGDIWGCKRKKLLKPSCTEKGYLIVNLYKDGHAKCKGIQRLVAETFIPNPENKPQVNHFDENPSNNYVGNLEWVTAKENCNWGDHNKKISAANKGRFISEETREKIGQALRGRHQPEEQIKKRRKKVQCITTDEIFDSISAAGQKYKISSGNITKCCQGKRKYAGKLRGMKLLWKYYNNAVDALFFLLWNSTKLQKSINKHIDNEWAEKVAQKGCETYEKN